MDWVDDWLAGLVHRSGQDDLTERFRHERFIVSRTVSTLAALAALPPYLLGRGAPTGLEILSLLALAAPLAAVLVLSATGRLAAAQALVSSALTIFVAGATASFGGAGPLALLAFAVVPVDALLSGSRRAVAAAALMAAFGIPLVGLFEAQGMGAGERTALATVLAVGFALALGHAMAQAVGDRRLKKHIRAALRAGEAREGLALQTIDDLVTWHDRTGSVLRANSAGAKLVAAAASSLHGRGLFGRVHVADRPAYLRAISEAANAAEPVVAQFRVRTGEAVEPVFGESPALARLGVRRTDDLIWVEMRAHRLRVPGEDGATVVAVTRDITGHKRQAEDLEAQSRQAKEAREGRARLVAALGRELRGPLQAIVGYAEMLKGKIASPGSIAQDYAERIHRSGQDMLGHVAALVELSGGDARRDAACEPVHVEDLVTQTCRVVSAAAERAGVAIAQEVAPNLPDLRAQRQGCEQILQNLLSNAVRTTARGGLVTVEAKRDGDSLALTVRDGGASSSVPAGPSGGFPRRLRADQEGLGLSVVRGLADLHRGRVSVAGGPGEGMSVTVSLPVESGAPGRALPARGPAPVRATDGALALKTG